VITRIGIRLKFSPVNAFYPLAEVLANVHGEGVVIQLVHLLQVLTVELLKLVPLRHLQAANNTLPEYRPTLTNNTYTQTLAHPSIDKHY